MCGICGELSTSGGQPESRHIEAMATSLAHRGPDDSGVVCCGPVGLGHRRLSIIDLSSHGHQPMWSQDGSLCIVFNGEVYNYKEIARDLAARGYRFRSSCDTEVVVNAIHCWGMAAVSRFIGMFAFAVWDRREETLTLCRDRAGIKPLHYYVGPDRILFGSELKALMAHPAFPKALDPAGVAQFFITGYSVDPYTVFRDTFRLTPGHYATIRTDGSQRLTRYWDIDEIARDTWTGSFQEATEALEELLTSAYSYRLVSDVPVGMFLSGGIDSSLGAAILRKRLHADILNITIGFEEGAYDEAPTARRVASEIGARHRVHMVSASAARDVLLQFPDIFDEPFGDTSGIPTYILSRLTRQHVKVALSADGGDEQFGGYESYSAYVHSYGRLRMMPPALRRAAAGTLEKAVPAALISILTAGSPGVKSRPQTLARFEKLVRLLRCSNVGDVVRLMNEKGWSRETVGRLVPAEPASLFQGTVLSDSALGEQPGGMADLMMRTDFRAFLRDDVLTKVDRASMAVSLECRDPMLDHRLTEFAFRLPLSFLIGAGEHKRILKSILRQWVSEDVVGAPKRGFSIPLYYWLRGPWKPIVMEFLSPERVRGTGVLNPREVEREVGRFYRYEGYRAEKIWLMLSFQLWAARWYD